jgi:hypothetical protein
VARRTLAETVGGTPPVTAFLITSAPCCDDSNEARPNLASLSAKRHAQHTRIQVILVELGLPLRRESRLDGWNYSRGRGDDRSDKANVGTVLPRRATRFGQEGDHGQEKVQGSTEQEHLSVR